MSSNISEDPCLTQENDTWILILERILKHPQNEVWNALTKADQIPSWGPFRANRDLISTGAVELQHIDMPEADVMQGYVLEVDVPKLLVFRWGEDILRWELREEESHTFLTLRHRFAERSQAPSYAAGWHLCLDGLAGTLNGENLPSMAGHNAMKYGWQELYNRYAKQLDINPGK